MEVETQAMLVAIKAKLDILDSKEFKSINNETLTNPTTSCPRYTY